LNFGPALIVRQLVMSIATERATHRIREDPPGTGLRDVNRLS
jgi:hypothetical protein